MELNDEPNERIEELQKLLVDIQKILRSATPQVLQHFERFVDNLLKDQAITPDKPVFSPQVLSLDNPSKSSRLLDENDKSLIENVATIQIYPPKLDLVLAKFKLVSSIAYLPYHSLVPELQTVAQPEPQAAANAAQPPNNGHPPILGSSLDREDFPGPLNRGVSLGPYLIQAFIGQTPTAYFYLARDTQSFFPDRFVVLKDFRGVDVDNRSWRDSIQARVRAWLEDQNPGPQWLIDVQSHKGHVFLVTEDMRGRTLAEHLAALPTGYERLQLLNCALPQVCLSLVRLARHHRAVSLKASKIFMVGEAWIICGAATAPDDVVSSLGRTVAELAQLLQGAVPGWIRDLVTRCGPGAGGFSSIEEVAAYVRFRVEPEQANQIRLSASGSIHYDLEIHRVTPPNLLKGSANSERIASFNRIMDRLGDLAMTRAEQQDKGYETDATDREIRTHLENIAANTNSVLGRDLPGLLGREPISTLSLFYDWRLAEIPWELFRLKQGMDERVCLCHAMSRLPFIVDGRNLHRRRAGKGVLRVLIVTDFSIQSSPRSPRMRDVAGSIHKLFHERGNHFDVQQLPSDHDFLMLTEEIGQCDVLVFLGHGVFHESENGKLLSGLVLSERSSLLSDVLNSIWNDRAPLLVITTACHSARSTTLRAELTDPGIGFAQAALATGVRSFLGIVRQLPNTKSAAAFVQFVCQHLLEGRVISQAVLEARRECLEKFGQEDLSWALFTLFGDPFTRLAVSHPEKAAGDGEWHQERSAHA